MFGSLETNKTTIAFHPERGKLSTVADTLPILPDPPEAPSAEQLRLFPMFSPLVERLGRDFLRRVPAQPGVYLMSDDTGRLDRARDYFAGASMDLVDALATRLGELSNRFLQQQQAADLDVAREFYQRGPRRNAELGSQLGRDSHLVFQEELDDMLVRAGDGGPTSIVQTAITEAIQTA